MEYKEIKEFVRQTNTLPDEPNNEIGAFSTYYDFGNGVGAKVILKWCLSHSQQIYKSKKALLKSRLWKAARREVKFLCQAEKSGLAPKFYGLRAIKMTNLNHFDDWFGMSVCAKYSWCPAIFMEHIEGMKLDTFIPGAWDSKEDKERQAILRDVRTKMLKEARLKMSDIQEDNVIVVPFENHPLEIKNIRVIDFTPVFCKEVG